MFRLTTPTHEFLMDLDPNEWSKFIVSYSQHSTIILEKTESDEYEVEQLEDGTYSMRIKLSQEETQLFNPNEVAYVQIRCAYDNGDSFASEKLSFKINDVINQTIM